MNEATLPTVRRNAPAPGGQWPETPPRAVLTGAAAWQAILVQRAQSIATCMREVESTEARFAAWYAGAGGRTDLRTHALRRHGGASSLELSFARFLDAVGRLRIAWQLFYLRTAAEGLNWQDTLRRVMPGLFTDRSPHRGGLRRDTTFSYAFATAAEEVATCFSWRLAGGCCAKARPAGPAC